MRTLACTYLYHCRRCAYKKGFNNCNEKAFETEMKQCIVPFIKKNYRIKTSAGSRALAGLSMGGINTLYTEIYNTALFSYPGVFGSGWILSAQSGVANAQCDYLTKNSAKINNDLKVFWLSPFNLIKLKNMPSKLTKVLFFQTMLFGLTLSVNYLMAQNPLITTQFTADPSVRVFDGKMYLYPSHDILATPGHGRVDWFCMQDYHVFSSPNLTDWTDHGVIVSQNKIPWADSTAYSMWAPDCIERDGKYYFYFPATVKPGGDGRGFAVGVAVADKPYGPFVPQTKPIAGLHGIDPNVQIDKDGQAYIYWAQGNLYGAKLKANMLELASDPVKLDGFPDKGLKEGPYLFERKGIYYMTYPHVANNIERLEYAMANNPLGPFKYGGVIMDESASHCWTNHQSFVEFKNQWYLFYHNNDLSPKFDKNRSVRADSLFFNEDGTIRKVNPTLRGVGLTNAKNQIQIDRFTAISGDGAHVESLDTLNRFKGWKVVFDKANASVQYNSVDFGQKTIKNVQVNARSATGGVLLIKTQGATGKVIAEINVPKGNEWSLVKKSMLQIPTGIKNLVVELKGNSNMEVDWVSFQ